MKLYGLLLALALTGRAFAEELTPYSEDPAAGARLFQQKGCIQCHSLDEAGGKVGPNLARIHMRGGLLDTAAALWNHAPHMAEKMKELRIERPQLTSQEMANLIAFLSAYQYYLKELGKPGDPQRGKLVFESKNCAKCHSLERSADFEKVGPSLRGYARLSPIQIAQEMWNHGPAMAEEFRKLNLAQPKFTGGETADLMSYLQSVAAPADAEPVYVEPGSPSRGRALFEKKGCVACHAVRGDGGSPDAPDLGKRREELVRSVTDVAGAMWSHGTAMWDKMRERQVPAVKFAGNEMADIIAYLYFVNYFDRPGDFERGKQLFNSKGCVQCHTVAAFGGKVGPDLGASRVVGSPIDTVTAMWNHAAVMQPVMRAKGVPWPKFESGEMADLMEFLYSQHKTPSATGDKSQ